MMSGFYPLSFILYPFKFGPFQTFHRFDPFIRGIGPFQWFQPFHRFAPFKT